MSAGTRRERERGAREPAAGARRSLSGRFARVLCRVGRAQCLAMALMAGALSGAVRSTSAPPASCSSSRRAAELSSRSAPHPNAQFRLFFEPDCSSLHLVFAHRPTLRLLYCAGARRRPPIRIRTVLLFLLQVAFRTRALTAPAARAPSARPARRPRCSISRTQRSVR